MGRRRVWAEFLPPQELAAPATLALLRRYELQPLIALPAEAETGAMAQALRALTSAGVSVGLWPLLGDDEGYWASAANSQRFVERVEAALVFARLAGASVRTIAVDLEPPIALKRQLMSASLVERAAVLGRHYRRARATDSELLWHRATGEYRRLASRLRAEHIESLAIAVPPLVLDLLSGTTLWQRIFSAPLTDPGWSTLSPMIYSSMIRQAFTQSPPVPGGRSSVPGGRPWLAQTLLREACASALRVAPGRVCLSLGVVGAGKHGDEASFASPCELARDVALVRAAGVDDLALFSLESVLARPEPERWFQALATPASAASSRALGTLLTRGAGGLSRLLSKRSW